MALKMRKDEQRVVIQHVRAHRHFREPFAALDRQHSRALFIHDINRRKIPAVDSQRLAVLGRRIARALIIGIRFDNIGFRQFLCYKRLDPRTRDDVRAVRLARMQLDADFAVIFCAMASYALSRPAAERSRVKYTTDSPP